MPHLSVDPPPAVLARRTSRRRAARPPTDDVNSVDTVRVAMRGLHAAGMDPEPELRRAGAVLVGGSVRAGVSRHAYCRLWKRMSRASGRDDFGLLFAEQAGQGLLGPLEWLATTAATVGEGLDVLAQHGRLLHTGGEYAFERSRDEARFVYHPGDAAEPGRAVIDWSFAYLLRALRRVSAEAVAPIAVHVQYARPAAVSRVEEAFGAPVRFGAALNEVVLSREQLDVPLVTFDPEVHATLAPVCRSRCAASADRELRSRVRTALLRELGQAHLPSLAELARALGMSARTLQRGLTAENLSYRALVLEARMETAARLLLDPRRTATEVASDLGYSDPSAFHRAYRGYFGHAARGAGAPA